MSDLYPTESYPAGPPMHSGPTGGPRKRPGTVVAAAVVTWVFSGLALLGSVLFAIAGSVARDDVVAELEQDEAFGDLGIEAPSFVDGMVAFGIVAAVLSVVAIVVAVLAFSGSQVGRILLVVLAGVASAIALVGSLAVIPFLWVIAGVSTIVLLFTGGASEWYAERSA